jgi:hypothetical protein
LDSAVQTDNQPKTVRATIESLSKAIALCLTLLYVCGFLITSLHDFRYGFSEMNPLRPRILTAGAWFLVSVALPFAFVRELLRHKLWNSDNTWWFKFISLAFAYWVSCTFLFGVSGGVFVFDGGNSGAMPHTPIWQMVVGIAVLVIVVFGAGMLFGLACLC